MFALLFVVSLVAMVGSAVLLLDAARHRYWSAVVVFLLALVVGSALFGAALQSAVVPVVRDVALAVSIERGL